MSKKGYTYFKQYLISNNKWDEHKKKCNIYYHKHKFEILDSMKYINKKKSNERHEKKKNYLKKLDKFKDIDLSIYSKNMITRMYKKHY